MRIDHTLPEQLPGLKSLWAEAFGDPESFIDIFFSTAYAPERSLCISRDGEVLAAAYWFDVEFGGRKGAYVYAVATAVAHRGQGLCRKLMEAIHTRLRQQGYVGVILVPGDDGLRQMYSAMGYADFGGMDLPACRAAETPVATERISPEEYCALRRQYLPEGGVLQEGPAMSFLARYYRFYRTERCLAVATLLNGILFSPEFLGDPADIPGFLAALGARSGNLRMQGNEPFAMYHPLAEGPTPGYFAFAFD